MKNTIKNITRYTYRVHAFEGWRVAISRQMVGITLYFSDCKNGGKEAYLKAAKACKAEILHALEDCETREDIRAAFAAIKSQYKPEDK